MMGGMKVSTLSKKDRKRIIEILNSREELPIDFKHILFPPEKREYELVYAEKEREEDILADTMAVPLQPIKTFGKNGNRWINKLIFGDNLQVMKSLLDNPDIKGQVKLIYIDPPFATKQEFRGSQDQKAYQDKIAGARFIEHLRKRLLFFRELLSRDGSLFVHLDLKRSHYIKVIMDEIFGERIENEIIWHYPDNFQGNVNRFPNNHNVIYFYSMSDATRTKRVEIPLKKKIKRDVRIWDKESQSLIAARDEDGKIIYKDFTHKYADDVWPIGQSSVTKKKSSEFIDYPTQKPEELLRRVIECSTEKGDLVLDAFAGSGTALAVAEKLGRRWIGIDCGKLAIYTIQKRILNLKKEIANKGKKLKPKPFTLYHAGLYDFPKLKKLNRKDWCLFALHLFSCRDQKHLVSGIELDGYKGRSDVLVFDYQQKGGVVLDYGFIDDLHSMLGSKIGKQFFIIAPAASVMFLEDYINKGSTRYYILRIPYSIINEIHNRDFAAIKQPIDESQVNDTVDAVGFDFIRQPKVACDYLLKQSKGQLKKNVIIKIKTFKSEAMLKGASQFPNRESLSMVMVDIDYDGEIFNLDKVFYANDIEKNGWEVLLPIESVKDQMMIIYLDIYGNEYREIKNIKDFKSSLKKKPSRSKK
jgi:site-specific DNA-methyltransferase (adenine-specific)/adenine-specific DNA-methyltransferase